MQTGLDEIPTMMIYCEDWIKVRRDARGAKRRAIVASAVLMPSCARSEATSLGGAIFAALRRFAPRAPCLAANSAAIPNVIKTLPLRLASLVAFAFSSQLKFGHSFVTIDDLNSGASGGKGSKGVVVKDMHHFEFSDNTLIQPVWLSRALSFSGSDPEKRAMESSMMTFEFLEQFR